LGHSVQEILEQTRASLAEDGQAGCAGAFVLEHLPCEKRTRELSLFSLEKDPITFFLLQRGCQAGFSQQYMVGK